MSSRFGFIVSVKKQQKLSGSVLALYCAETFNVFLYFVSNESEFSLTCGMSLKRKICQEGQL